MSNSRQLAAAVLLEMQTLKERIGALESMLLAQLTEGPNPPAGPVKLQAAITTRRQWTREQKLALVRRSYAPGMSGARVAKESGITVPLLFKWRRQHREGTL